MTTPLPNVLTPEPCPFCGSSNVDIMQTNRNSYPSCKNCGATGPTKPKGPNTGLSRWNTRTANADKERLDTVEHECWDVRCIDQPTGQGDADVHWIVIGHHMAKPHEREVGIGGDTLRQAIDNARKETR
jgi:hypothetical protein